MAFDITTEFQMPFKPNGVRDWIRDYLDTYTKQDKKHIVITGDEQNDDEKMDDSHKLDRACIDLLELKASLQIEADKKNTIANEDFEIEEQIRATATKNLVLTKDVGVEYKKPPLWKRVNKI